MNTNYTRIAKSIFVIWFSTNLTQPIEISIFKYILTTIVKIQQVPFRSLGIFITKEILDS